MPKQKDNPKEKNREATPNEIDSLQTAAAPQADASYKQTEADKKIGESIKEVLEVDIKNRKEQFFKGQAKTVSSINDTGEFDVLPKHANFVTLIKGYVIVDKGLSTEKKFEVDSGVLAAKTGAVDVYLDF